jgi:hypothetical protein
MLQRSELEPETHETDMHVEAPHTLLRTASNQVPFLARQTSFQVYGLWSRTQKHAPHVLCRLIQDRGEPGTCSYLYNFLSGVLWDSQYSDDTRYLISTMAPRLLTGTSFRTIHESDFLRPIDTINKGKRVGTGTHSHYRLIPFNVRLTTSGKVPFRLLNCSSDILLFSLSCF